MREPSAVFLAFAALGVWRAAPGVTTGDAGELAAASAVLGVAHAPGYPLYALLGRAFGLLMPFGAWTHRINMLSAVLGAAALALLTDALSRWGFSRPARLGAVAVLGLTTTWLESAAVTEVFSLHAFMACLLLWSCSSERAVQPGPAAAVGLLFGLSLGNHQTMALILPSLLLLQSLRARTLAYAALGSVLGLSVYAYLPLRASASPPLDWGHAVTFPSFLHVLLRKDYGSFALTTDGAAVSGLPGAAREAVRGLSFLGAVPALLALAGAALWPASVRLPRRAALAWLLAAGPLFLMLGRPGFDAQTTGALSRFALLPLIGAALLAAAAFERLGPLAPAAALAASLALLPRSSRADYLAHDYGRALLDGLPKGALFVMDGGDDTFYSLAALKWADGLRPDVELRDRGGVVFPGLYGPDFRRLPRDEKEARRRAVERSFSGGRLWYSTLNPQLLPGLENVPAGLVRRALPAGAPFPEAAALDETVAVRLAPPYPGYRDRALAAFVPFSRGVSALARGRGADALSWLELASELGPDALWLPSAAGYAAGMAGYRAMSARDYAQGERAYRDWLELEPGNVDAGVNLGTALERQGRGADAEAAYRAAAARSPSAPRPWDALGALNWSRGRWEDAAAAFEQAAAREPGQPSHQGWASAARRKLALRR
jgi:tetratricopeptide (TPR) repeat protein